MQSVYIVNLTKPSDPVNADTLWWHLNLAVGVAWDPEHPDHWVAVAVGYGGGGVQESVTLINDQAHYQILVAPYTFATDRDEFGSALDEDECQVPIDECPEASDAVWARAEALIASLDLSPYLDTDDDTAVWTPRMDALAAMVSREGSADFGLEGQVTFFSDNATYELMEQLGAVHFVNVAGGHLRKFDIDAWFPE